MVTFHVAAKNTRIVLSWISTLSPVSLGDSSELKSSGVIRSAVVGRAYKLPVHHRASRKVAAMIPVSCAICSLAFVFSSALSMTSTIGLLPARLAADPVPSANRILMALKPITCSLVEDVSSSLVEIGDQAIVEVV
jgi:hypothetical protein